MRLIPNQTRSPPINKDVDVPILSFPNITPIKLIGINVRAKICTKIKIIYDHIIVEFI